MDKRTGKEVWVSELADEAGHTAGPVPMAVEGVPCVVLLTLRHLAVIRLDTSRAGKTVATFHWVTDFAYNVVTPAVRDNFVLITSGCYQNAICKRKVTLAATEELWRRPYTSKVCIPVVHKGNVYFAWQKVRCLHWETGELRWEVGAFGDRGWCVVTADDRHVVYGRNGKVALVETATRSPNAYKELVSRDGIFGAPVWPHVALSGGRLFCRDRDGNLAFFRAGQ